MSCVLSHVPLFVTPWTVARQASSVYEILQARIMKWVAISYFTGSPRPMDPTIVSYVSCVGRYILYHKHHPGGP